MATYVILSCVAPGAFKDPKEFKTVAKKVAEKIRSDCPGIKWKHSFSTLGRFDVVDIVETDDPKEIEKATLIIRGYGHSTTETLQCTPWDKFIESI